MLVSEFLERVRQEIDKEGSPYFEDNEILNRLTTATYSFLEQNIMFIQYNQKAREDFSKLTVEFKIKSTKESDVIPLNSNFYRLVSLEGVFTDKVIGIPIVQSNDLQALKSDPFHSPDVYNPKAEFYNDSLRITPKPKQIQGLYLKQPVFNTDVNKEVVEGLPINIQLFLLQKVVLLLLTTIEDTRFQMQYYNVQNKNTDS